MSVDSRAQGVAATVTYELSNFLGCAALLLDGGPYAESSSNSQCIENALLEAWLIHTRVLRDFLLNDDNRGDDVQAIHFFDAPEQWRRHKPPAGPYLNAERTKDRLDRALAHLAYSRAKEDFTATSWNIAAVVAELMSMWEVFWISLPAGRQAWFNTPTLNVESEMALAKELLQNNDPSA
jgi:hypothetical protein